MKRLIGAPRRLARRMLPFRRPAPAVPGELPAFAVPAAAITTLADATAFRQTLLELIATATRRIVIVRRAGRSLSPAAESFVDELLEAAPVAGKPRT